MEKETSKISFKLFFIPEELEKVVELKKVRKQKKRIYFTNTYFCQRHNIAKSE